MYSFTKSESIWVSTNPNVPIVEIVKSKSTASAQKKLIVEARIQQVSSNGVYQWNVITSSNGLVVFNATTVLYSPLIIPPNVLPVGEYEIRLTVKSGGYTTMDKYVIQIVPPPNIVSFSVAPITGVALETNFTLSAMAQSSSNATKLTYSFYYRNLDGSTGVDPLGLYQTLSQLTTKLPPGSATMQGKLQLICVVEDEFGASASHTVNITTTSPTFDGLTNSLNQLQTQYSSSLVSVLSSSIAQEIASNNTRLSPNISQVIDNVINVISNGLSQERSETGGLSMTSVTSSIHSVEKLTRNATYISSSSARTVLQSMNIILDAVVDARSSGNESQVITLEGEYDTVASSLSNIYMSLDRNSSNSTQPIFSTLGTLSSIIMSEMPVAAPATRITTQLVEMVIKVNYAEQIASASFDTSRSQVLLPPEISETLLPNTRYAVEMMSFSASDNPYAYSPSSQNISSSVISFRIVSNDQKVKVHELSTPIEIVVKKMIDDATGVVHDHQNYQYECRYWDETTNGTWDQTGCYLFNETDTEIICHCNHTTSFSAFIIYDPKAPNKASTGLFIAGIIVYAILAIISLTLLVVITCWRNEQPIKSRFLVPYIGLTAVLIESVLNGVIRNSVLVSASSIKDYVGANALSYVSISICNPIVLVSAFIYFWQMVRYMLMKHLYALMDVKKPHLTLKRRFLRLMTSKWIYTVIAIAITVLSCVYYVLLSILEATHVIRFTVATPLNAISFAVMYIVIGLLIIACFMWDISFVFTRKLFRRVGKNGKVGDGDGQSVEHIAETSPNTTVASVLYRHFTFDDPLKFRVESIFMTVAMILMVVSFIIGIVDRFDEHATPYSGTKIVQFLFDVAYTVMTIIAFGAYVVLVRLVHRIKYGNGNGRYGALRSQTDVSSRSSSSGAVSNLEQQLLKLLSDEHGLKMISEYAKKEFSLENIILWKHLASIRSEHLSQPLVNSEQICGNLTRVYDLYVASGSPFEVNVPAKTRRHLTSAMRNRAISTEEAEQVLTMLHNEIMINVSDTFSRFLTTPEFVMFTENAKLSKELMDIE